jgi:polysaccharide biosynthesis transport protein
MKSEISYYLARFWRRFPYFLVLFVLMSALGVTAAFMLPAVYRAEARLLVEAPQIPDEMAPTTVRTAAAEILQVINERLTTRDKLIDLARTMNVYDGQPQMDPDKLVIDMAKRIRIILPGASDLASFVTVSFDAPTAEMTARVTQKLVDAIVQESITLRTANASQTLEFFQSEVNALNEKLSQLGGKILQLKLDHKDALPDSLEFRRTRQTATQERLRDIERQIAGLQDRRARLVEIYEKTGSTASMEDAPNNQVLRIQQLEEALAEAKSIYAEDHPKVRLIEAQIATIKRSAQFDIVSDDPGADTMTSYDLQLADLDGQITFLNDDKAAVEAEMAALQASIDATPGNAIELDVLQRDYENIQLQYNTAVARLSEAATGDRIESLSKGQRITIVEPPVVPAQPAKPNRKMIAAGGVGAGLVAGLALVFLLEWMNRSIERPVDLVKALGITPLATIPYFGTKREKWRKRMIWLLTVLILAGFATLIYMERDGLAAPLADLLQRLLVKAGIG